jgi:hypothetical protein
MSVDPFGMHPKVLPALQRECFTKFAVYVILAEQLEKLSRSGVSNEILGAVRDSVIAVRDKVRDLKEDE